MKPRKTHVRPTISASRLITFSDGVFAIVITLLVLGISVGNGNAWQDLHQAVPELGIFGWSFFLVAQFWQLHVYLFSSLKNKDVPVSVANSNSLLLFFVALLPFATQFFNKHFYQAMGIGVYAAIIVFVGLAQLRVRYLIIRYHKELGDNETQSVHEIMPYLVMPVLMALSVPAALLSQYIAYALWAAAAVARGRQIIFARKQR